ncbi:MAG TPA: DUF3857 domain-containing protein, partial [Steroidobacteraceae bacterium]|nr:DUF3857 domain-containing protein [Steroidobacteraceae bacterium]
MDRLEVQETYEFAADGSDRYTQDLVYKVLTPAGVQNWKELSIRWSPWRDSKPAMRARVIAPDGTAYTLDPATITDTAVQDESADVYSDERVLR